jgi:L-aspartate oxidase
MMGGVATDLWGRTTLPGLLACGEVANTGVHGANRLASNSLLETVVFAQRAVEADDGTLAIDAVGLDLPADAAPADRETLQALLWDSAGIVRDGAGLRSARAMLDGVRDTPSHDSKAELTNMTLYGRLIVEAALRREESRGAHFRADFPTTEDVWARSQSFEAAR